MDYICGSKIFCKCFILQRKNYDMKNAIYCISEAKKQQKINAHLAGNLAVANILKDYNLKDRIFFLTDGQFSLISIIHELLKKTGKADVIISTWSAGFYDIHAIKDLLISELIGDIKFILDHSFVKLQEKYAFKLNELFGLDQIRTTETHGKFVLISNENYKIVISSSMNLNENPRCETCDISTDLPIYEMLKSFSDKLFNIQDGGLFPSNKYTIENWKKIFSEIEGRENLKENESVFKKSIRF